MDSYRIGYTELANGVGISTVMINGIYETCIFYPNGDSDVVNRCGKRTDAIIEHNKIVMNEIENENADKRKSINDYS